MRRFRNVFAVVWEWRTFWLQLKYNASFFKDHCDMSRYQTFMCRSVPDRCCVSVVAAGCA
jgi:hypothetical protein